MKWDVIYTNTPQRIKRHSISETKASSNCFKLHHLCDHICDKKVLHTIVATNYFEDFDYGPGKDFLVSFALFVI